MDHEANAVATVPGNFRDIAELADSPNPVLTVGKNHSPKALNEVVGILHHGAKRDGQIVANAQVVAWSGPDRDN